MKRYSLNSIEYVQGQLEEAIAEQEFCNIIGADSFIKKECQRRIHAIEGKLYNMQIRVPKFPKRKQG